MKAWRFENQSRAAAWWVELRIVDTQLRIIVTYKELIPRLELKVLDTVGKFGVVVIVEDPVIPGWVTPVAPSAFVGEMGDTLGCDDEGPVEVVFKSFDTEIMFKKFISKTNLFPYMMRL